MFAIHQIQKTLLCAALAAASIAGFATEASAQRGARRAEPAPAAVEQSSEGVVNIQTATLEQLQLLPGIGPAKAQAIVTHRDQRAFRQVEDIMRVRGIGRATFRRLRPMITVQGPTTLSAEPTRPRSSPEQAAD